MAKKISRWGELLFLFTMFLFAVPISDLLLGLFDLSNWAAALISIIVILVLSLIFYNKILMIDRIFITILSLNCLKEFILIVALVNGMVIISFASFYYCVDRYYHPASSYLKWFYFSVITLTTVGHGDVMPINGFMQMLVTLESLIGYILLPIIFTVGLKLIMTDKRRF